MTEQIQKQTKSQIDTLRKLMSIEDPSSPGILRIREEIKHVLLNARLMSASVRLAR